MRPPMTVRELASRKNSIVLGVAVALTALFLGWIVYAFDYLMRVANGPEPVTQSELIALGDNAIGRWFDVSTETKPGHLLKTTSTSRRRGSTTTTTTNHFALFKKDVLIVETSLDTLPPKFLAWASEFNEENSNFKRAQNQLWTWSANTPALREAHMAPMLLKPSAQVANTQYTHGTLMGLASLVLLYLFWHSIRRLTNYQLTSAIAKLRNSVRAGEGVPALVAEIDGELAARDPLAHRNGLIFLPSWLISASQSGFSLMSAADVIWAAPYIIKKKLYGVITTSTRYEVRLMTRTGQTISVAQKDENAQALLTDLYHWAPWAVVGSNPAMEARFAKTTGWRWFKNRKNSLPTRTELLKAIDDRRAQIDIARAEYARQVAASAAAALPPNAGQG